jgi:hypothetical protein
MSQENINPIRHGLFSTVGGVSGGAVGGGLKSGIKTILVVAGIGAAFGLIMATGGFGLIGAGAAAGGATHAIVASSTIWNGLWGALGGALGGTALGSFLAPFTGTIGLFRGASHASHRIREERGAANMVDAQLAAIQAQAYAAQQPPVVVNNQVGGSKYPTMNQTENSSVQGDSLEYLGKGNAMQLQAGR